MQTEKKTSLSMDAITDQAIKILNQNGLEGLTMRSLAAGLGIKAASLYWHFNHKHELYAEIAERLCAGIKPSCGMANACAYLVEIACLYRTTLLSVRDSVTIFTLSAPFTPRRLDLIKNILMCLLHLGIKEKNCMIAAHLYNNYILSFAADERIMSTAPAKEDDPFANILGPGYDTLPPGDRFLRGLDVLFAGFEILK